jgi:hypothetical protein
MGFTLEMLPNEPIMIVTGKGALTVHDFNEMFADSRKLLAGMKGPIYRIVDFTESTTSFMDLIRITQISIKGEEGTTTDSRIKPVIVGTNQWVSLGRTIFEQPQFSGMHFPTMVSMEDALIYARTQLAAGSSA